MNYKVVYMNSLDWWTSNQKYWWKSFNQ